MARKLVTLSCGCARSVSNAACHVGIPAYCIEHRLVEIAQIQPGDESPYTRLFAFVNSLREIPQEERPFSTPLYYDVEEEAQRDKRAFLLRVTREYVSNTIALIELFGWRPWCDEYGTADGQGLGYPREDAQFVGVLGALDIAEPGPRRPWRGARWKEQIERGLNDFVRRRVLDDPAYQEILRDPLRFRPQPLRFWLSRPERTQEQVVALLREFAEHPRLLELIHPAPWVVGGAGTRGENR